MYIVKAKNDTFKNVENIHIAIMVINIVIYD